MLDEGSNCLRCALEVAAAAVNASAANAEQFGYPANWTAELLPTTDGDTAVRVLPHTGQFSRVAMSLVITRNADVLAAPKPIVGKGMTLHDNEHVIIDGQPGWRVRFSGVAPNGSYSHALSWQFSNPTLHIAFSGTASGEPGDPTSVDKTLYAFITTFGVSARSLKFEPTKPPE